MTYKVEYIRNGYIQHRRKEVTVKEIFFFMEATDLLKCSKEMFIKGTPNYNRRIYCNCCGKRFKDGKVYMAFTDDRNKLICEKCKQELTK